MGKYLLELYLILLHLEIGAHKYKAKNTATLSLPVLGSLILHLFRLLIQLSVWFGVIRFYVSNDNEVKVRSILIYLGKYYFGRLIPPKVRSSYTPLPKWWQNSPSLQEKYIIEKEDLYTMLMMCIKYFAFISLVGVCKSFPFILISLLLSMNTCM